MTTKTDHDLLTARRREPHWLYRLFNADGELLYIGQTRRPVARFQLWLSRSRSNAPWFLTVTRVDWQAFPDWWLVTAAEKRAIETERPQFNRNHQPQRVA